MEKTTLIAYKHKGFYIVWTWSDGTTQNYTKNGDLVVEETMKAARQLAAEKKPAGVFAFQIIEIGDTESVEIEEEAEAQE